MTNITRSSGACVLTSPQFFEAPALVRQVLVVIDDEFGAVVHLAFLESQYELGVD